MRLLVWALIQSDWCPYIEEEIWTQREETKRVCARREGQINTQ